MIVVHATLPLILAVLFPAHMNLFALLIGSGIPNFDVFPTLMRKKTPKNALKEFHAASILHTPFFYLVLLPPMYFALEYFGVANSLIIAVSFMLGGVLHIVIECIDEKGRLLFYPFSRKFYGYNAIPYDFWTYLTSKRVLIFEGSLVIMAAAAVLIKW